MDVLFVLDASSSVKEDFDQMKQFVLELGNDLLTVGPDAHRVALIEYSGKTRRWPRFDFGFATTTDQFLKSVAKLPHLQGKVHGN